MLTCLAGNSQTAGASIIWWTRHGDANQHFFLEKAGVTDGKQFYFIRARHSQQLFDVCGGSQENNAKITQYPQHGGENQQFSFISVQ